MTFASGSSGNCALISAGETHILLDAGISCRRITTALSAVGLRAEQLSGILVTHEHSDHIAGLSTLNKRFQLPVYATPGTARQLCCRIPFLEEQIRTVHPGVCISVGQMEIRPFPTSHDAAESVGYVISSVGRTLAFATDLGWLSPEVQEAVRGAHLAVIEANHDVETLLSGPYPYHLKQRILGEEGHLSNQAGAELACVAAAGGAHTVVLAHLSHENNTPAMALHAVSTALSAAGHEHVRLSAAPRSETGARFTV